MGSTNKHIIAKTLPVTILFVTVYSVIGFSNYIPLDSVFNNTTIWWAISGTILILFFLSGYYFYDRNNNKNMIFIFLYIAWNIISLIRGSFVAEIYWDWKALIGNSMVLLLPIVTFPATNLSISQSLMSFYTKYTIPIFIIFAFIIRTDAWGFYLMGVTLLIIFIPIISSKHKALLFIITAIVLIADLGARSNVIKFSVPILLILIYYFREFISTKTLSFFKNILFITPIILFILGVTGVFNVFKMKDYLKKEVTTTGVDIYGDRSEVSLTDDTRTFLFEEVLSSAIKNDYWLYGRTPTRGNDSYTFGLIEFELTGRYERLTNEIGLANVFTWSGIIGVILYLALFYHASSIAISKSNNIFVKILGIYIAFRWLYSWIEDYQNFSLNFLLLWVMIGLCLSNSFRDMSNKEIKIWVRGIFDTRYVRYQKKLLKKSLYEKSKNSSPTNMLQ